MLVGRLARISAWTQTLSPSSRSLRLQLKARLHRRHMLLHNSTPQRLKKICPSALRALDYFLNRLGIQRLRRPAASLA